MAERGAFAGEMIIAHVVGHVVGITFDTRRYGRANRSSLMSAFVVNLGPTHQSMRSMFLP